MMVDIADIFHSSCSEEEGNEDDQTGIRCKPLNTHSNFATSDLDGFRQPKDLLGLRTFITDGK